jgi:diadenosine tetraphosphate (Ap4A) HIT family hydrolase
MMRKVSTIAKERGLSEEGYRVVINDGKLAGNARWLYHQDLNSSCVLKFS